MVTATKPNRRWLIYKVTCLPSGKSYVGMTCRTVDQRWASHVHAAKKSRRPQVISRAIYKYGPSAFVITTLSAETSIYTANAAEIAAILHHKTMQPFGYNVATGGVGCPGVRRPHSAETRDRIGAAQRGKIIPPDVRAKMSAARNGMRLSPTHRSRIAAAGVGRNFDKRTLAQLRRTEARNPGALSGFSGVTRDGTGWMARIKIKGCTIYLGRGDTPEQASTIFMAAVAKRISDLERHQ